MANATTVRWASSVSIYIHLSDLQPTKNHIYLCLLYSTHFLPDSLPLLHLHVAYSDFATGRLLPRL